MVAMIREHEGSAMAPDVCQWCGVERSKDADFPARCVARETGRPCTGCGAAMPPPPPCCEGPCAHETENTATRCEACQYNDYLAEMNRPCPHALTVGTCTPCHWAWLTGEAAC